MPYKSKAQHRLFRVLESQGKLPPGKASEWYHETKHPKRLPDHKGDPVKERLRDKAQKMYAQGKSVSQVARALGVQESTAEKWRWAGGVTRKSTRRDPERKWDSGGSGYCDGCGKKRKDVRTVAWDSNGDPEVGLCFFCRKKQEREEYQGTSRYLRDPEKHDPWGRSKNGRRDKSGWVVILDRQYPGVPQKDPPRLTFRWNTGGDRALALHIRDYIGGGALAQAKVKYILTRNEWDALPSTRFLATSLKNAGLEHIAHMRAVRVQQAWERFYNQKTGQARRDPTGKGQTWYVEYRVVRRGKVERANLRQEVYAYTSDEALSKTKGYAQADWEADSIYPLYVATVPSSRASESVRNQAMVTAGRWAKRASGVKGMWL